MGQSVAHASRRSRIWKFLDLVKVKKLLQPVYNPKDMLIPGASFLARPAEQSSPGFSERSYLNNKRWIKENTRHQSLPFVHTRVHHTHTIKRIKERS